MRRAVVGPPTLPTAMDACSDPYSLVKPDSPWRWVPVFVGPLGFLAMGIAFETQAGSWPNLAAWTTLIVLFMVLLVSRAKDGMADAFMLAVKRARTTGGHRISSRPALARTLIVAGLVMVVTPVVLRTMVSSDVVAESAMLRVGRSFGCLMPGLMLVLMGVARPWDLAVAERDSLPSPA